MDTPQTPKENIIFAPAPEKDYGGGIKSLAYGGKWGGNSTPGHYRNERGKPFFRVGKAVTVVPQFKGLTIYSPINTNLPGGSFKNAITSTAIAYPFIAK